MQSSLTSARALHSEHMLLKAALRPNLARTLGYYGYALPACGLVGEQIFTAASAAVVAGWCTRTQTVDERDKLTALLQCCKAIYTF